MRQVIQFRAFCGKQRKSQRRQRQTIQPNVTQHGGLASVSRLTSETPEKLCAVQQAAQQHEAQRTAAQALMERAWASAEVDERVCLAHQALTMDPACVDAVTVLALHAPSGGRVEDGIRALERVVDKAYARLDGMGLCEAYQGRFWQQPDTRAYVRALGVLARLYSRVSHFDKAIEAYRRLLAADQRDTQGHRYALASLLIRQGDYAGFHALDQRFNHEHSVMFLFHRVLVAYIETGRQGEALSLVKRALVFNPHAPQYLALGTEAPMPEFKGLGHEVMAWLYATENHALWARTPGALRWLLSVV